MDRTPSSLSRRRLLQGLGTTAMTLPFASSGGATPDSRQVPFERSEHAWRAMHTTTITEEGEDGSQVEPYWVGQSSAGLSLLNVNWEDWGNPNPSDDGDGYEGCWRYTFAVNSLALAIRESETTSGGVYSTAYLPDADSLGVERGGDSFTEIGSELSVRGPDSEESEEGQNEDRNIAISPRHDPQLFSVIDGEAIWESFETACNDDPETMLQLGEAAGVGGRENVVNGRRAIQRVREDNQDAMAVTGVGLGTASLAVAGLATVFSGGTVLLVAGASLAIAGIVAEAIKLLGDRSIDWLAPNRGFRVNVPTDEAEPAAGYSVVFDAYVTPNSQTHLTIGSEHPTVRVDNDEEVSPQPSIADFEWQIDFDAPPAPDEADVGERQKYRSAWLASGSTFHWNQNQPPIPGYNNLTVPAAVDNVSVPWSDASYSVDVYRLDDTVSLEATDPILHSSSVDSVAWTTEITPFGDSSTWCGSSISPDPQYGREFEIDCHSYGYWTTRLRVTDHSGNTGETRYDWVVRKTANPELGITWPEPGNEAAAATFPDGRDANIVEFSFEADTGRREGIDATWSCRRFDGGNTRWEEFGNGEEAELRWVMEERPSNELLLPLAVKFEMTDCTGQQVSDRMEIQRLGRAGSRWIRGDSR